MTFPPNTEADPFLKAVEHLRAGLPALETIVDLADIESSREMVYGRYGHSFAPEQLPNLSAEEYLSFLRFENNHHWTGINRYGSRTVRDMPILRQALGVLVDEQRPLAERYDLVTGGMVEGIGRATATPILHVAYPDRYGVWNTKVEAGLKELSIFPNRPPKMTDGQLYAEINELLLELAAALDISLWTLDNLWEWMSRRRTLASPFDKIFADRAQAEHIFDRFADAVERLGGRPDDPRFALTLPHDKTMMRLNIGNSMVIDVADQGKTFHLTALIDEMEKVYQFERDAAFRVTVKGTKNQFAVYTIPPATMLNWPLELQVIFERSMPEFGREFANWEKSNLRWAHNNEAFEALFNEEVRNRILVNGLGKNRYWRITMPSDMRSDMDDGRGDYNFWADCLRHGLAAIGFDNQPNDPQIAKFASIQPGDRVVAFLRNKQIGGAGIVTSSLDEKTEKERPPDKDYFHGGMWRRIGVDWTEIQVNVDDLPDGVRNKFLQSIVMELTEAEFTEVEKLIDPIIPPPPPDNPSIAHEFKGFTLDAFAFMRELAANNNKAWMDDNRERWRDSVLEPMRSLFTDLGPHVKSLFDPYLLPDELEITPTTGKVLARINKDWTATPNSKYHEYYWGAFYRERLTRQTDAQLFVTILPNHFCFGLSMGEKDDQPRNKLRGRIIANREQFYDLITELGLIDGYDFIRTGSDDIRNMDPIRAIDDLSLWSENGRFDVVMPMTPQKVVAAGPNLADVILESFRRIFPIYLWAVIGDDDDYKTIVADYLESEFPDPTDPDPPPTSYTLSDFIRDTHLTGDRAEELRAMLEDKQQVIFSGPPGTGKTYVARRLARLLTGLAEPPPERLTVVQFHAAYGYEEFIEGIRPRSERGEDGRAMIDYPVRPGAFVRFCRAAERIDGPCVFIIDEINRGNIPRIFGELMYLLEYRQKEDSIPLPYSGERFRIPPNVYVIGTMNTADRSIALVDFALRRRFHFTRFAADPDLLDRWLADNPPAVPWLGALYRALVEQGIDDLDYAIGPSVFMRPGLDAEAIRNIWNWSVMPYLREYHIDRRDLAERWEWDSPEVRSIRNPHADEEPGDSLDD